VLLQKFRHFPVKNLSGGMKRRLSVAISLVSDPKIIYLDEPSTGLDPENRRQLWDILSA
jgi:ABC-type multidrug transport system ATPase subunit